MIRLYLLFSLLLLLSFLSYSQENDLQFKCGDSIIDVRDGQVYSTILIGKQCWTGENLNIGLIVHDLQQTDNGIHEKTCYNNNPVNCDIFGGLYTWHEAMSIDTSGFDICPVGWSLPSKNNWEELTAFLGFNDAGQQMKVTKEHNPSWDGTNNSGFTALPAGTAYESKFGRMNHWALFWSSTEVDNSYAWFSQLDNYWYKSPPKYKILYIGNHFTKENGFSVRCIKNEKPRE